MKVLVGLFLFVFVILWTYLCFTIDDVRHPERQFCKGYCAAEGYENGSYDGKQCVCINVSEDKATFNPFTEGE